MAKTDVIAAAVAAIQSGEAQVLNDQLGSVFDSGLASAPVGSGGGFTQADIDAAVAAAQGVDAAALAAAQADFTAKMATLQTSLDAMTAKEQMEETAVAGLQTAIASVQASFDAIKAILLPAPPVMPAPPVVAPAMTASQVRAMAAKK